jgi:putative lipoic acid-binding regulatory protein
MAMSDDQESLLTFPCRFPIKAMGPAGRDLESVVLEIVSRHAEGVDTTSLSVRSSRGGKWVAVTLTIEAHSRSQLDAIYRELTAHELVAWAL